MTDQMKGKAALITGGSSGIGKAAALVFAREGASVAIASRTRATGEQAAQEVRDLGVDAFWIGTDVTNSSQAARMVAEVVARFGRLDYAFNNGGSGGDHYWLDEMPESAWDMTINGYLKSVWLCMKYELAQMRAQGYGAIVNNSSVDGQRGYPAEPAYSAAKHGVLGLTKSAALQYATLSIRINAVCPGWIKTPLLDPLLSEGPEAKQKMLAHQPIGRLGEPQEVAEAVVWLCSDKASLVTGTALAVDGGYLAV